MKKAVLTITLIATSVLLVVKISFAQDFSFDRAFQDYQYSLSVYNQAYSDYQDARDFYRKNQTLTLKEDARKKTLEMLRDRDQLFAVYLTALRMRILELPGLSGDEKNNIFGKIDSEVQWYKSHKDSYKDGDPLEDLFNKSKEAEDRYQTNTLPLVYESLITISLGEEIGIRLSHEEIYSGLKSTITNPDPFSRWISDTDSVISTLKQNEDQTRTQIPKLYGQLYSITGSYNTAIQTLASSVKSLTQLNSFITEMLTAIKNQI